MEEDIKKRRRQRKSRYTIILLVFMEIILVAAGICIVILMKNESMKKSDAQQVLSKDDTIEYLTDAPEVETEPPEIFYVPEPDIDEQILTVNEWSRPGVKIKELDYLVVHYLGNPKTTGQANRDYFESLKDLQNVSMSANYVIGLDGEIIHCVPDDEVAYASNRLNSYSISIENCHPDETGKFTDATYKSLVKLVAYLSEKYGLDREHIIRHHDVTGKDCPKYFVDHPDAWERFLDEVFAYRQACFDEGQTEPPEKETVREDRELAEFLEQEAAEASS